MSDVAYNTVSVSSKFLIMFSAYMDGFYCAESKMLFDSCLI